MEKKYILTDEIRAFYGRILHRIQAVRDFGKIQAGDLGGWIEKEGNLSHGGNCWIYDDAKVYDNALIHGNAQVCGDARVYNDAHISGNALIYGNTMVRGNAFVSDNVQICGHTVIQGSAVVRGNVLVRGNALVSGNALVRGNAQVYDNALVNGYAQVYDNAQIYGNAKVSGNVQIYGDAIICEEMFVSYSKIDTDLRTDIAASLRGQCNLLLIKNKVIAYKIVNRNLTSLYDKNFVYKIGEIAEVENPDESNASCASGLHFSNLTYWDDNVQKYKDKTYLVAEINVEDIITIQQGKIRCKKAKILDKVDIQ